MHSCTVQFEFVQLSGVGFHESSLNSAASRSGGPRETEAQFFKPPPLFFGIRCYTGALEFKV